MGGMGGHIDVPAPDTAFDLRMQFHAVALSIICM
jgi:hypothetical protein